MNIDATAWACEALLSVLAMVGHDNIQTAERSFNNAKSLLTTRRVLTFKADYRNNAEVLEKPLQKPMLLKAMATGISADGIITPDEIELLRAVAVLLDCPIPPLLNQQKFI